MVKAVNRVEPEGFAEFWDIWRPYRRQTDGRQDAARRFGLCVLEGADPQEIIEGARFYIDGIKDDPEKRRFNPLAASWLSKGAWRDALDDKRDADERKTKAIELAMQTPVEHRSAGQTSFLRKWNAQKREEGDALQ
jgi:hypothetical protein